MTAWSQWVFGRWLFGMALLVIAMTTSADAPTRVLWDKRPIIVQLQIGRERMIHFPGTVRYWLPDSIKHKVSTLVANGVLYIQALKPFSRTRIRVQGLNDQRVYLLDVIAGDAEIRSQELIVMVEEDVLNRSGETKGNKASEDQRIRLTRYAAQQLYAPERLTGGNAGIKRIPLSWPTPVPLIRGGLIDAVPIAAWQGSGLTVTAVRLRNTSQRSLQLSFDPSSSKHALNLSHSIRGHWLTATLQHNTLEQRGNERDTTTLYLVSDRPFVESLGIRLEINPPFEKEQNGG